MTYYFTAWHTHITAEAAEREREDQRLFGPSFERRQRELRRPQSGINKATYAPWKKPRIERQKAVTQQQVNDEHQ